LENHFVASQPALLERKRIPRFPAHAACWTPFEKDFLDQQCTGQQRQEQLDVANGKRLYFVENVLVGRPRILSNDFDGDVLDGLG